MRAEDRLERRPGDRRRQGGLELADQRLVLLGTDRDGTGLDAVEQAIRVGGRS
jgi:hypothetical protein